MSSTDPHAPADRFSPADAFLPGEGFAAGEEYAPLAPPAAAEPPPAGPADAGPEPLPGPFLPTEGVWPNRAAWATGVGAVLCLGIWQFGLWEVELSDPPAGVLAANPPADSPASPAADPAALDWGEEWDPAAGLAADPVEVAGGSDPAAGDAFDLLAADGPAEPPADADLWGDDPTAAAESAEPAAEPAEALASVAFDPPAVPAADPPAAAAPAGPADFWAEPPAADPAEPAAALAAADAAAGPDPFAAGVAGEPVDPFAPDPPADAATAAIEPVGTPDDEPAVRVASASSAGPADAAAVVPADRDDPFYPVDEPTDGPAPANAGGDAAAGLAAASATESLLAAVDAAIEAGELLEAHTALSRLWWDAPDDRPRVRGRLDGTARQIYFDAASHFMTPRTVAAGETLADVAADLSVPAMYLARVNRVAPSTVGEGDELKVIRGPFGAACDLAGGTLTVHAHGYYVRAFHCDAAGVPPGNYAVAGKAGSGAGVSLLLTPADGGDPVKLSAAEPTGAAPGLDLSNLDAGQVFDLLDVGGTVVVRP